MRELCATRTVDPELELTPPLLHRGEGAAFDVGAHRGDYTYVMQKILAPSNVYAIEPNSVLCRRLKRLFPAVTVLQLALSDHEGELDLKTPIINGQSRPTRATLERFKDPGETGAAFERIRVQTLDQLCVAIGVERIRYIKIDVEGHEEKVLAGASRTIERWRPILQVEIEQRHHRNPVSRIFKSIISQGYSGFFLESMQRRLRPLDEFNVASHPALRAMGASEYINNFLFFSRDSTQSTVQAIQARLAGDK